MSLLDSIEFAQNPEPRCPCVLLLDTSGSMSGERIDALNEGLQTFQEHLNKDNLARKRVEVAIITFNSEVKVVQDFVTADTFKPSSLNTSGFTSMGSGIIQALDLIQSRKAQYHDNGISYYRPWVFLITDGEPTDDTERAVQRLRNEEGNKRIAFFAVGVQDANMERLKQIAVRTPIKLKGLNFQEMFVWLSTSMQSVSQSKPGDQVPLSPPGWGEI